MTASLANKNLWRIIGAKPGSTTTQLKSAYRHSMRHAHTDSGGSHEAATLINLAWEVLEDEDKRQLYVADRKQWADKVGAILCAECGEANRVLQRPTRFDRMVCGHCKAPIELNPQQASSLQTKALQVATEEFVQEFGELIIDKVRSAIRKRLSR